MRASEIQSVVVESGRLGIGDPGEYFPELPIAPYVDLPEGVALFSHFGGDGNYNVYAKGPTVVVDTAPDSFRASRRSDLVPLGAVGVDSGMIAFFDAALSPRTSNQYVVLDVVPGTYRAWMEGRETSRASRRLWVLGFGPQVELLMHGEDANALRDLEDRIADALRGNDGAKAPRLELLRQEVLQLHVGGTPDPRLKMLAAALKLKLPSRPRRQ